MKKNNENMSFEEAIKKLQSIVEELEKEDISLESSIDLYKKGMSLSKFCHEKIKDAETTIQTLEENSDSIVEKDINLE